MYTLYKIYEDVHLHNMASKDTGIRLFTCSNLAALSTMVVSKKSLFLFLRTYILGSAHAFLNQEVEVS